MERATRSILEDRANVLTSYTYIPYIIAGQDDGVRLETKDREQPVSPRFKQPKDLLSWIDGAIVGAHSMLGRYKLITFFNSEPHVTEKLTVNSGGFMWEAHGNNIVAGQVVIATWDNGAWIVQGQRYRNYRMGY